MKRKPYTEKEILAKVEQIAREAGVARTSIHRWQAKSGGTNHDDVKRQGALEEEHRRLRKLAADLALDNSILKEVVGTKE